MNAQMKFCLRSAFAMLMLGLLGFQSCSFQEVSDPGTSTSSWLFKSSQHQVVLSNANGRETSVFYDDETLFIDLLRLEPLKQYCFEVAEVNQFKPFRTALVVSDSLGRILDLPLLVDIGFDPVNHKPVLPGNYEIRIQNNPNVLPDVPFQVVAGPRPNVASIIPTNNSGDYNGGTVLAGANLYAKGSGFPSSTEVRLYVVADGAQYNIGAPLTDVSGGFETVTTTAAGELPNILVWAGVTASSGTALDLIADLPPFGEFNATDALREAKLAGVVVQNPPVASDIVTDLAVDANGMIKDVFAVDEVVAVKANPPQQPLLSSSNAAVYVVVHQNVWNLGDRLISVANQINKSSHDMPNFECIRLLSGSKSLFPLDFGPLLPGRYDVIVDVGRNTVYDRGTDILDGGSKIGFTVPGSIDSIRLFVAADKDFRPEDNATNVYAKLVREDDSPISGIPVTFEIQSGPGALSIKDTITETDGVATSVFSGGSPGVVTIIKVTANVNGKIFTQRFSIYTKVSPHDQGRISTDH